MKAKQRALCPAHRGLGKPGHKGLRGPTRNADKLVSFITQLTFLAIWKTLTRLSSPVTKVFAVYVWAGRSAIKICSWIQSVVLRLVGWLASSAFPKSQWLQQWSKHNMPLDVRKWHVAVAVMVTASLVSSLVRRWRESFDECLRQLRHIQQRMQAASSYAEWREFAQQLDKMGHCRGGDSSGKIRENLYDRKLLQQKLHHLQSVREHGNVKEMMFALRTDLIRNIANIAKSQLHEHYYEVPSPIREYIQEVKAQLAMLTDWPDGGIDMEEKLAFFKETRHAFGRTALLLSGGGGLGSFHIGVVKALFEHTMLPRVLAGSSVGSIVAGIVATRTDDELRETFKKLDNLELSFFNNKRAVELVHSFLQKGALHDMSYLQRKLKALIGNYTFLEAYERTGRILNVSVCPADTNEPARLLNYLTAPQALIWSAVAASSAFPGLFHPQDLLARNARGEEVRFSVPSMSDGVSRRWRDGSLELDLPTFLLSEMFNCNHFIVSQTNPHIVPLLNLKKSLSRRWANLLELELRHRCAQMQWILPDWVPTKWLTLFTQPWEGDITLVLPSHLWKIGKTMINPTTADIMQATRQGELAIWEKLSVIETNCTIEATLDACLARLTNKARERPLSGLCGRIPSWLSMPTIGQQAVASWGNPLDAGASPGGRLWGIARMQSLPHAASTLGHLPSIMQAPSSNPTAAAAAAASGVLGSSFSGRVGSAASAGGLGVAPGTSGYGYGSSPATSAAALLTPSTSSGESSDSKDGAVSQQASVYAGAPATVSDAIAAMAHSENMGGLHRGYSYTAAAMHHAHLQQHGIPEQQQQEQLPGLGPLPVRHLGGTGYNSSSSPAAIPPTIHEGMPDDRPPRVTSWGSNDIADSVSDFPASSGGGSSEAANLSRLGPGGQSCIRGGAIEAIAAEGQAAVRRGHVAGGLLATFDSKTCLVDDEAHALASDTSSNSSKASRRSPSKRSGVSRRSSSASSNASGSSGSFRAPSDVLGHLDCCDSSVMTDIWSSLLPLATSSLTLQAVSEGLDFIAP